MPLVRAGSGLAVAVFLGVALAGCLDGTTKEVVDERPPELPPDYELAEEGVDEEKGLGSIVGRVVDDEWQPLRGALVGFIEPYVADVTNELGEFEIGQLTPGKWDLYVVHMGHKADGLRVRVEAGRPSEVVFVLPVLPVEVPWIEFKPFEGRIQYDVRPPVLNVGPSCCDSETRMVFNGTDKASAIVGMGFALDWTVSNWFNTGLEGRLEVENGNGWANLATISGAQGPLEAWLDAARMQQVATGGYSGCTEEQCSFRWTVDPYRSSATGGASAVGLAYEQRFNVYVAYFYRDPPPSNYQLVPFVSDG